MLPGCAVVLEPGRKRLALRGSCYSTLYARSLEHKTCMFIFEVYAFLLNKLILYQLTYNPNAKKDPNTLNTFMYNSRKGADMFTARK